MLLARFLVRQGLHIYESITQLPVMGAVWILCFLALCYYMVRHKQQLLTWQAPLEVLAPKHSAEVCKEPALNSAKPEHFWSKNFFFSISSSFYGHITVVSKDSGNYQHLTIGFQQGNSVCSAWCCQLSVEVITHNFELIKPDLHKNIQLPCRNSLSY